MTNYSYWVKWLWVSFLEFLGFDPERKKREARMDREFQDIIQYSRYVRKVTNQEDDENE